jgi:hypothetical protein
VPRQPSRQFIAAQFLDNLFGEDPRHDAIARDLLLRYNDNQGCVTSMLRYLAYYKTENGRTMEEIEEARDGPEGS